MLDSISFSSSDWARNDHHRRSGQPGAKYEKNRHNIGFMAADEISRRWRFGPERAKFQVDHRRRRRRRDQGPADEAQTYMNESGRAVGEAARFYKIKPSEVIVFHDEIDLAPGRFRMKTGGGAAGQNGIRSLISHLGADFRRARMGIGHPGEKELVMPHVLGDFHKAEQPWLNALLQACAGRPALCGRRRRRTLSGRGHAPGARTQIQPAPGGARRDLRPGAVFRCRSKRRRGEP